MPINNSPIHILYNRGVWSPGQESMFSELPMAMQEEICMDDIYPTLIQVSDEIISTFIQVNDRLL